MYEIKISYVVVDKNGNDKTVRESLVLENAESFANAEEIGYDYGSGLTAIDVTDIKRSKIKEVVNQRTSDDEYLWLVELMSTFTTEEGEEREMKYKVLVFAKTFNAAKTFMSEYIKQGYAMDIIGIKKTNYTEVLK